MLWKRRWQAKHQHDSHHFLDGALLSTHCSQLDSEETRYGLPRIVNSIKYYNYYLILRTTILYWVYSPDEALIFIQRIFIFTYIIFLHKKKITFPKTKGKKFQANQNRKKKVLSFLKLLNAKLIIRLNVFACTIFFFTTRFYFPTMKHQVQNLL